MISITRGNTIRIINSSSINATWINKLFNLSYVHFNKELIGRRYCEVEFTASDENIKPTDIMDKTLLCEIILVDGSRYLVSSASNVSIDSELMFGETELKVTACFDSWTDEKIPELAYKDNISMILS